MRDKVVKVSAEYLALRWTDRNTGQVKQKRAGTSNRKEAERLAAQLDADLKTRRYADPSKITWEQFRERFEVERGGEMEKGTKLWQNLRSSRETELADQYPIQVVTAWIGNSIAVAKKHYLQVTDDHFKKASECITKGYNDGADGGA
jgi:hypothetical protein